MNINQSKIITEMTNILYCGHGWAPNIGNAFIDKGILYQLKKSFPNVIIHEVSNTNSYLDNKYSIKRPYNLFRNKNIKKKNFDLRTLVKTDLIVLGGALFNINWFKINKTLIDYLINSQKKVLIIGGGGGNLYNKEQTNFIQSILRKINLIVLVARDEPTYESYREYAKYSYNGIDSAFFLNDCFKPAELDYNSYIISVFDFLKEPKEILNHRNIIRLYHNSSTIIELNSLIRKPLKTLKIMGNKDWVSDYPDDYLHLFANADITFSDRVHACVASLAYGNKAKFYHPTHRSYLFDRVGLSNIRKEVQSLDNDYIVNEKQKQIDFLTEIMNNL